MDSRFRGNDRWVGMTGGWGWWKAGMTDGPEWRNGVALTEGWQWWRAVKTDAVALRSPSFPRKRESRDLCDRKAGIGRAALGSWCPIGVWDELRGMM